jgi:hypothetical protein
MIRPAIDPMLGHVSLVVGDLDREPLDFLAD